jgi:hypothetical protein
MHLSMMQSDLPYITDLLLKRHPFNCIALLLSLRQKIALFERSSRVVSQVGFS